MSNSNTPVQARRRPALHDPRWVALSNRHPAVSDAPIWVDASPNFPGVHFHDRESVRECLDPTSGTRWTEGIRWISSATVETLIRRTDEVPITAPCWAWDNCTTLAGEQRWVFFPSRSADYFHPDFTRWLPADTDAGGAPDSLNVPVPAAPAPAVAVAVALNPGEGCRLLDSSERIEKGDEYLSSSSWTPTSIPGAIADGTLLYRRKLVYRFLGDGEILQPGDVLAWIKAEGLDREDADAWASHGYTLKDTDDFNWVGHPNERGRVPKAMRKVDEPPHRIFWRRLRSDEVIQLTDYLNYETLPDNDYSTMRSATKPAVWVEISENRWPKSPAGLRVDDPNNAGYFFYRAVRPVEPSLGDIVVGELLRQQEKTNKIHAKIMATMPQEPYKFKSLDDARDAALGRDAAVIVSQDGRIAKLEKALEAAEQKVVSAHRLNDQHVVAFADAQQELAEARQTNAQNVVALSDVEQKVIKLSTLNSDLQGKIDRQTTELSRLNASHIRSGEVLRKVRSELGLPPWAAGSIDLPGLVRERLRGTARPCFGSLVSKLEERIRIFETHQEKWHALWRACRTFLSPGICYGTHHCSRPSDEYYSAVVAIGQSLDACTVKTYTAPYGSEKLPLGERPDSRPANGARAPFSTATGGE